MIEEIFDNIIEEKNLKSQIATSSFPILYRCNYNDIPNALHLFSLLLSLIVFTQLRQYKGILLVFNTDFFYELNTCFLLKSTVK